jgi:copper chaperone CopZ
MEQSGPTKRAVLDLLGAHCTACAITIEHAGRRLPGVKDIVVDRGTRTIQVEYEGDDSVLADICAIVDRIGYEATIRTSS